MIKTTMIRVSQKALSIEELNELYSSFEENEIRIRRIFDPRFSLSGDDLIIEGDIENVLAKISRDLTNVISFRFETDIEALLVSLKNKSGKYIEESNQIYFYGTTLVDCAQLYEHFNITENEKIISLLLRTQLGSKMVSLMPVKAKGVVIVNKEFNFIEFILPTQRIQTLKNWIETIKKENIVDFDILVDIFRQSDPSMRKKFDEDFNWITKNSPNLATRIQSIEEQIDISKVYEKSKNLFFA